MQITTEYAGKYARTELIDILDFLCNMAEIAISTDDFVRKVEYGTTDHTTRLSDDDRETLVDWYVNEYPKLEL